jgi:glycosyltransferase involved in cell wall biosynthesis
MAVAVLLPAYNPDERLVAFAEELRSTGSFPAIIVVDDGSRAECRKLFARLAAMPGVTVLRHAANQGKGAALKTGLDYFCRTMPGCLGVVTADADGQHLARDVARVARKLEETPQELVLGSRRFTGAVPLRSRLGNGLTKYAFRLLVGKRLEDTQSGLRGIPRSLACELRQVKYSGYEFELEMLIRCKQTGVAIQECPIATVYLDDNRSSHFNPLVDSLRIYCVLLRFVAASLMTAAVDYAVFVAALPVLGSILGAQAGARLVAGGVNYYLARRAVFHSRAAVGRTLLKYVLLVVVMGLASYSLIQALVLALGANVVLAKIASELLVYAANFLIQRDYIFQATAEEPQTPVVPSATPAEPASKAA